MQGWRRIGAVLSVLWFAAFGAWLWKNEVDKIHDLYAYSLHRCYQYLLPGETRSGCDERATASSRGMMSEFYASVPALVLYDAATVGLFWLVAWILVGVGRWVAAGFGSGREPHN
jgi:hypothetical protein